MVSEFFAALPQINYDDAIVIRRILDTKRTPLHITAASDLIQKLNMPKFSSFGEADYAIAEEVRRNPENIIGIMGNDTDFYFVAACASEDVAYIPFAFFDMQQLSLRAFYCKDLLRILEFPSNLNTPDLLLQIATICGNDYTNHFHLLSSCCQQRHDRHLIQCGIKFVRQVMHRSFV